MTEPQANAGQDQYWNAEEARHWIDEAGAYDRMLAPFATRLLEAATIGPDEQVLDIGCGTGPTTCDAARVAPNGHATGLDISRAMIEAARARASREDIANVSFEVGDAQTRRFEQASVDVAMSRFGVMFFDDPVAAFTNIHSSLRDDGRLVFVCWQDLIANEWMAVPGLAAAQHVPLPDPGPPGTPGPFSFGDADHVRDVLASSGYRNITVDPLDESMLLGGGGSPEETTTFLRNTGMGRALFSDASKADVKRAIAAVEAALEPYVTPEGVRLSAAGWLVRARA
jgi:SAM-dependent methyltransferase